ncbi:hypothetical protein [Nocardia sp. NPDC051750]|uniref:hypothetical protein n=1 Tax=Nocardia sp. NPDC051750 TaxID=3364325 RepID=UPI0037BB47AC
MPDIVRIQRIQPDLWTIAPPGSPSTAGRDPGLDTAVLEVVGGYLTWSLTAGQRVPAATLHDLDAAQEWLWALYGADVALAVDEYTVPVDLAARPERPDLAATLRRLGYAHWAARWWPASTVDGIAALDPGLLEREIAELAQFCESVVDGADSATGSGADADGLPDIREADVRAPGRSAARADDYALAAGGAPADRGAALLLGRGNAGWDWRYCPAGVVDASERAVSWELFRSAGGTTVRVHAVVSPSATAELPAYLSPHALIRTPAGSVDAVLELSGDTWTGEVAGPADSIAGVEIYVPGIGPTALVGEAAGVPPPAVDVHVTDSAAFIEPGDGQHSPGSTAGAEQRQRIRELVRTRLRMAAGDTGFGAMEPDAGTTTSGPGGVEGAEGSAPRAHGYPLADIAPLRAEIAAVEEDSDF